MHMLYTCKYNRVYPIFDKCMFRYTVISDIQSTIKPNNCHTENGT